MAADGVTTTTVINDENAYEKENSVLSNFVDVEQLKKLGLKLLFFFLAYKMGHYEFSFLWILGALLLWFWGETNKKQRLDRRVLSEAFALDEKKLLRKLQKHSASEQFPSWIYFPDVERAEWLNKIIGILWPYVGHYVRDFVTEKIEPSIKEKYGSFKFVNIILGDKPFKISGIKVFDPSLTLSRKEIIMDVEISYAGDCDFLISMAKVKAGVKDIQFRGTVRIIMSPLVSKIPLVGALQILFLQAPLLDFNLTNAANLLDNIPGLKDSVLKIVTNVIGSIMLVPNKFTMKLISDISDVLLHFPDPKGVLKINLVEAEKLEKKDGILGNSDPYAILSVGQKEFRSKTISSTTKPVWNFKCEVLVYDIHGQTIDIDVMDEDPNADDCLGRLSVDINSIATKGKIDEWISLEDAKSGRVRLQATWFSLCTDCLKYQPSPLTKEEVSSCILIAFAESAAQLPNSKKSSLEPSPFVRFSVDDRYETKACKETNNPVWNEGFCFVVNNPERQKLKVEVLDEKTKQTLGDLSFAISELMGENDLKIERPFHLKNSELQSSIKLCLQLKIMVQERIESLHSSSDKSQPTTPLDTTPPTPILTESAQTEQPSAALTYDEGSENLVKSFSKPLQMDGNEIGARRRQVPNDSGKCRLQMAMRYSELKQTLSIVVLKVVNLPFLNSADLPDTFVKLLLMPGSPKDKRKTSVVKNSCNPIYDEQMEYAISKNEINNHTLQVLVCSTAKPIFARRPILGKAKIDLAELDNDSLMGSGVTEWFELKVASDDNGESRPRSQTVTSLGLSTMSLRRTLPKWRGRQKSNLI